MNRTKVLSFVFPLLALLFSSCSLETDNDAGRLEGMWHLVRIDNLTAGTTEDMSSKTVFWSFQARLLELEEKKGTHSSYLYRFSIDVLPCLPLICTIVRTATVRFRPMNLHWHSLASGHLSLRSG